MTHPLSRPTRTLATLLTTTLVGSALAACSSAASDAGRADGVLDVVGQFEVHSLDPSTAGGVFTRLGAVETLVTAAPDGSLRPGLATAWSSTGPRSWRFELRDGATFHDGTPVTADAVASALTTALETGVSTLTEAGVRAVGTDGDAVVLRLAKPFGPLPAALAHTSTQVLAPASYAGDGTVRKIIGSGPYAVTDVETPSHVALEASDHWDGDAPAIDRVDYQVVSRAENRALMVESGQADIALGMDPTSLQRLRDSDAVQIHDTLLPRTIVLKLNVGDPALADLRVRRALSLALDRDGIAAAVLRDPEVAANQLFPPVLEDWHQPDLAPLDRDLDQARDLLSAAGYAPDADGRLSREGKPLTLTLLTFPDRPELPLVAAAVQEQLGSLGVTVDVQVENSSEVPLRHQSGTLQLALFARGLALVPDPTITLRGDYPAGGSDWGAMGWHDDRLLEAVDRLSSPGRAAAEVDADRHTVAEVLQSELPTVPVAWYRQHVVTGTQVEGLRLDPYEADWHLDEVSWS